MLMQWKIADQKLPETVDLIAYSNVLANITQHLIGQHRKCATVYSAIYFQKPDIMNNVTCDWST